MSNQALGNNVELHKESSRSSLKTAKISFTLLLLSALGQLYGNIAVLRIAGYTVTIPLLLFAFAAIFAIFSQRQRPSHNAILFVWVLILLWLLLSAVVLGWVKEADWQRSAALFIFNSTCFVIVSRLQVNRRDIVNATPKFGWLIILFGGLGVLQFFLLNFGNLNAIVPKEFAASQHFQPTLDIYNTAGLQRATGISLEPSIYALGLSLAMVIYLFFQGVNPLANKRIFWCAMVLLFSGLIVSFSVSGIAVAIIAILITLLVGGTVHISERASLVVIIALVVAVIAYYQGWFPALTDRMHEIFAGDDNSVNVRVVAALRLLFLLPIDFADFVAGQGIGMESNYRDLMGNIYGRTFGVYTTKINNLIAYIKVTQGWVGLALHFALILAVFRPVGIKDWSLYAPLFTTIIVLHFASGYYLVPAFWATLALVAVLRDANLKSYRETERVLKKSMKSLDRKGYLHPD